MTRKRRKRTNSSVPAKGRLRDMADMLWSKAVKADWGNKCAACGSRSHLNSHHLIKRGNQATRYDMHNGICLCATHHKFDREMGAHENELGFSQWLKSAYPLRYKWWLDMLESGDYRRFDGTTTAAYYCGIIQGLREYVEEDEFDRIVGIRFAAWLSSEEKENTDDSFL